MNETVIDESKTTLNEQISATVKNYFSHLNGEDPVDLYDLILEEIEIPLLKAVMDQTGNNQSRTAKILGISRGTLRAKLRQYFNNQYVKDRVSTTEDTTN